MSLLVIGEFGDGSLMQNCKVYINPHVSVKLLGVHTRCMNNSLPLGKVPFGTGSLPTIQLSESLQLISVALFLSELSQIRAHSLSM